MTRIALLLLLAAGFAAPVPASAADHKDKNQPTDLAITGPGHQQLVTDGAGPKGSSGKPQGNGSGSPPPHDGTHR